MRLIDVDVLAKELGITDFDCAKCGWNGKYGWCKRGMNFSDACFAIENAPTISQWIAVTERLPEYGLKVVTVDKDGEYEINYIIDEEDGEWNWEKPIVWMPLPEPWREK